MDKRDLDRNMKTIKTFQKTITGFFNPICGEEEREIYTYILEFNDEEEAQDFDYELENWKAVAIGPGIVEGYLNYRIISIVPYIETKDDGSGNDSLADNKALLIQNRTLTSLAAIEMQHAYFWLFDYISNK